MKYVFVGDVHGSVEFVERALAKEGKKIFVGDLIDSWSRTCEEHMRCYDLVFKAIDAGEAEACFGNHELSYLLPAQHRCNGWSADRQELMYHYDYAIRKRFQPYLFLQPDFLVSHAGITERLWSSNNLTIETLAQHLQQWWPDLKSPIHRVGWARGGTSSYGGIFWCDYKSEFDPIPGLQQVFGHTAGKNIRKTGPSDSWCIDAGQTDLLELDL